MSSSSLAVESLPGLCHLNYRGDDTDAGRKFYFIRAVGGQIVTLDSYRFTVRVGDSTSAGSFYKKSDRIYSICFIVYNNGETI